MPEAIISAKGTEAPTVRSGRFTSDKDTETKRFKFAVIGAVAVLGCFLTGAVLAALGGSSQISTGEDDDPSEE